MKPAVDPRFSNARKKRKKVKLLSRVQLFVTPWTVAYQAPPSMEFSNPWKFPGKSTGVGCHFLLLGIFLTQGLTEPTSPVSPALVGGFFPTETIVQSKHNFICAGKPKNARDSFILVFAFLWWCGSKPTSPRYTCIYEERGHAEYSRCHSQEDRAVRL